MWPEQGLVNTPCAQPPLQESFAVYLGADTQLMLGSSTDVGHMIPKGLVKIEPGWESMVLRQAYSPC